MKKKWYDELLIKQLPSSACATILRVIALRSQPNVLSILWCHVIKFIINLTASKCLSGVILFLVSEGYVIVYSNKKDNKSWRTMLCSTDNKRILTLPKILLHPRQFYSWRRVENCTRSKELFFIYLLDTVPLLMAQFTNSVLTTFAFAHCVF